MADQTMEEAVATMARQIKGCEIREEIRATWPDGYVLPWAPATATALGTLAGDYTIERRFVITTPAEEVATA